MKKKYIAIGAAIVLLGYGSLTSNNSKDAQETGTTAKQEVQDEETEQTFGGVLI